MAEEIDTSMAKAVFASEHAGIVPHNFIAMSI